MLEVKWHNSASKEAARLQEENYLGESKETNKEAFASKVILFYSQDLIFSGEHIEKLSKSSNEEIHIFYFQVFRLEKPEKKKKEHAPEY